ncbi:phosphonate metabolism transcriptional regulator PhnF [Mesorhizobium tianshanense]
MLSQTGQRRAAATLWRSVYLGLERDILKGEFAPGTQLPTESEFANRFRVHRHTVRRALQALQERDLIRIEHGRGSFVRERVIPLPYGRRTRFTAALSDVQDGGSRHFLGASKRKATRPIAARLQIVPGQTVQHIETLTRVAGRPVSIASKYFPLPRFSGIDALYERLGSATQSLRELGVSDFTRAESRISAIMPTRREAELLEQPRGRPVVFVTNLTVDEHSVPIQLSYTRVSTLWVELQLKF